MTDNQYPQAVSDEAMFHAFDQARKQAWMNNPERPVGQYFNNDPYQMDGIRAVAALFASSGAAVEEGQPDWHVIATNLSDRLLEAEPELTRLTLENARLTAELAAKEREG